MTFMQKPKLMNNTIKMVNWLTKPAVNEFEDISKLRNKLDKTLYLKQIKDTSLGFLLEYDRALPRMIPINTLTQVKAFNEPLDTVLRKNTRRSHVWNKVF